MRISKLSRSSWTAQDQAVYARWRKSVGIFYGTLSLILLVAAATYTVASHQPKGVAALAPPRAATVP